MLTTRRFVFTAMLALVGGCTDRGSAAPTGPAGPASPVAPVAAPAATSPAPVGPPSILRELGPPHERLDPAASMGDLAGRYLGVAHPGCQVLRVGDSYTSTRGGQLIAGGAILLVRRGEEVGWRRLRLHPFADKGWQVVGDEPLTGEAAPPAVYLAAGDLGRDLDDAAFAAALAPWRGADIEVLDLRGQPRLGDRATEALASLGSLRELMLADGQTDEAIPSLARVRGLSRLTVGPQVGDAGLAYLEVLPGLTGLTLLGGDRVTDRGLRSLAMLRELTQLSLARAHLTDAGLEPLARLSKLEQLRLEDADAEVTDAGLEHLRGLVAMTSLSLRSPRAITDRGLACLEGMTAMWSLGLYDCRNLTDAGLAPLARMRRLAYLYLDGCPQLTPAGLAPLADLPLTELRVSGNDRVPDAWFEPLRRRGVTVRR